MNDADMNEANAYAPPETDVRRSTAPTHGPKLGPDEARRLYNHSRSIGALVFLWCLGLLALVAIFIPNVMASAKRAGGADPEGMTIFIAICVAISLLTLTGIVGCWMRTSWGRVVGFIMCSLMLLNFWLGTLIGIFGLVALANGGRLFGADRLSHRHLKETVAAYKATKSTRRQR